MLVMRIEDLFQWPTCNLIVYTKLYGFFFFESLTNNRTVSSLETVLLFVEFKTYQTKGAKKFSHVGYELGTTGGPSRGLDHCTTVVTNFAVHKNKYSRKQKGHIVNTHFGGYSVGWVAIWATFVASKQFDMPHGTVRLQVVYWSHCEHALGWIFRSLRCKFRKFRARQLHESNLAPDSCSQHEMMTQKGANCFLGAKVRQIRWQLTEYCGTTACSNRCRSRGCMSTMMGA